MTSARDYILGDMGARGIEPDSLTRAYNRARSTMQRHLDELDVADSRIVTAYRIGMAVAALDGKNGQTARPRRKSKGGPS